MTRRFNTNTSRSGSATTRSWICHHSLCYDASSKQPEPERESSVYLHGPRINKEIGEQITYFFDNTGNGDDDREKNDDSSYTEEALL